MYVLNVSDDYDNINKCADSGNIFDMTIPTLLLTIPCGLSFLCLMSLMKKPLITSKWYWINFYYQLILFVVL